MEFRISTMGYSNARPHTCQVAQVASGLPGVNEDMKAMADRLAIADVARPVREVWQELSSIFYGNDNSVMLGLAMSQMVNRVYRARSLHYSVLGVFKRTWIDGYSMELWNVYGLDNELVARTNNPLERFNHILNTRFPTPHPSVAAFVAVFKQFSAVCSAAGYPRGRSKRVPRGTIELPIVIDLPKALEDASTFDTDSAPASGATSDGDEALLHEGACQHSAAAVVL
ncbi:unnamed protein product [Phytophthora fragariaefolia]|uniref:Unnamed protein product n=1 Tax=Phytophthora fragariaefolia TaxID=1490495 RepID=A0A9W6XUX6_9STRA|nr:unnamed protein product [Phytophthora fragariaefolia]